MKEKDTFKLNGFLAVTLIIGLLVGAIFSILGAKYSIGIILTLGSFLLATGLVVVQPNDSKVITFFGTYMGSIRQPGFWFTMPLTARQKISLKVRNFNSEKIKINDATGNPIEIAAVIVIRVVDSAKAAFDVDSYDRFVEIQAETALRHIASKYPYDDFSNDTYSLRGNSEEIAFEIAQELQARLAIAGVEVMDTRLTHLAYAIEIASAMLQRQQAAAILSARQIIVEGAVGMAQMAIEKLQGDGTVELDEERKIQMINNLMVAIVSDRSAQPVINTGTLY
ncbi:SPFH domain-containing protein [Desulforamulus aquiferis]|uniref:SPFH domain-containing protein n=1 Tax=Desulforamulus aquiferis TaxID=1397668 RepID=A0AAW7ZIV8_9FIRM|nr:SPFH domain-containing protein [Desulforamulus aquiferis]MDO7789117.1 SPFH domain-containing protein [Desulforamulus aquiferis]RYD02855.1 hypothetical protein N752_22855 [Desulforamulus aquiferis]